MQLVIGYFYPENLNLYGDSGNVEIIAARARKRGIDVEVLYVGISSSINSRFMEGLNVVFMGGGPDSGQKEVHEDLLKNKGAYLKDYIENGGMGLFVCGSYQLLGNYYKTADGTTLSGLGIFDLYTQHFGNKKPRCIGNVVCKISGELLHDPVFNSVNKVGDTMVGFENHGGRTYLGSATLSFGTVLTGHGNNSEDSTEGALHKNAIGTYLHGPLLSKNPHIADYLIAKSLNLETLAELDDTLVLKAHTASKKLRQ